MEQKAWEQQQKVTFIKWLNAKLKKVAGAKEIRALEDLADGVALCQLLESLYPQAQMPRYNKDPKLAAHKMDNLAVAFRFLETADIRVLTKPQNVIECNQTMVLGLLWTLVLEFDINRTMKAAQAASAVRDGKNAFNFKPGQAKDALLAWVRNRVAKYGLQANNFDKDFCDGNVLLGLVHSLRPDLFNWQQFNRSNAANNVTTALAMAETQMGIPALLDPATLLGGNPDEKSVMTYVVNFLMYEQENRDLVDRLAAMSVVSPREDAMKKQLEEQQRQLAEQKRQMEELARQKALLAQQQQLMQQQQQLAALEEQKRQMLALQQQQMQQQQQKLDMLKQQQEFQRQQQLAAELARQQQLAQQLAIQKQQAEALAAQQALLRQQQMQQQQQLQMAAELTRIRFFQALQQQQMEGVGVRDYVLFIDKSGSMAGSRWQEARKAIEALAPQITRASPQGSTLYFFNNECTRIDNVTTAEQVHGYFGREKPERGTNLSLALTHAFDMHFQKRPGKPDTWLIVTDGAPDRPTHVWEVLKDNFAKFRIQNEITISFIQIGASQEATDYLRQLKGSLAFCDSLTSDDLPKVEFSSLFSRK
jgi:hypothetical protein